jgi:hypothetical protein
VFYGGYPVDILGVTFRVELFWNEAVGTWESNITAITADDVESSTAARYSQSAYGAFTKGYGAIHAFAKAHGFAEQLNQPKAKEGGDMELPF